MSFGGGHLNKSSSQETTTTKRNYIPNIITIIRILGTVLLFPYFPGTWIFSVIYIVCGISDFLDGFLARKLNAKSEFGARFDTIADEFLFVVVAYKVLPIIISSFEMLLWIIGIALLRLLSMGVCNYRFKSISMLHTYANKITGGIVFLIPLVINIPYFNVVAVIACVLATYSSLEELYIQCTASSLELDRAGFWR